jgi:hypothetical protein
MGDEIYGFWDFLFPLYLMYIIGVSIFAMSLTRGDNMFSLNIFGMMAISVIFVGYFLFFVKQQIDF